MAWHGIGVRTEDGDPPPESKVEPSTPSEPSTDPLPPESGLGKPNSQNVQEESRGLDPKKGLTGSFLYAKRRLPGKTLYTLYSEPNSLPDFAKAVDELKGDT
jgi:hypothetical protein